MILLDKGQSAFFANAGHAGNVIGGIAHQGLDLDHFPGRHAVLFANGGGVHYLINGALRGSLGQDDADLIGDELERDPVAGTDKDGIAVLLPLPGQAAQDIIRLVALHLQDGVAQKPQHFLHQRHLLAQFLRHTLAGALVLFVHFVPEGGCVQIKGKGDHIRLLFLDELINNIEKAVNSIGIGALPGGEQPHAVKGTVDDAVGIKGKDFHDGPPCGEI